MRGRPVIQWVMFIAVWCGLFIPIRLVTSTEAGRAKENATKSSVALVSEPVWMSLRFSSDPASFSIIQDEKVMWEESQPDGRFFEKALPLRMQPEGLEFMVVARVSGAGTAMEVKAEAAGFPGRHYTVWGGGDIRETISFTWSVHE